jgi:hypothetical protein
MHQCPMCRKPLPHEHWRVLADHAVCQKPVPLAPEADHSEESGGASLVAKGIDRLMTAVEGVVAAINPSVDTKKLDE